MRDAAGLIFLPMALIALFQGVQGWRRGRITWLRGSEDFWGADRENDPIAFHTGVFIHIACGLMMLLWVFWLSFA